MDRLELIKYKGQNISVYQLGNDRLQFGILTDVKNDRFRLKNDRIGTIYTDSVYAIGDGFA